MVCCKAYYIKTKTKNIAPATHVLALPNYNPLDQTTASHSLPNIPPFYPSLIVPASPSRAIVCCVCLPACWLYARIAVGMNDCSYRVDLLRGIPPPPPPNTHTHTDCSENGILILVGAGVTWKGESFQSGFKRWQGWAASKVLWEWIPIVGSKARESAKAESLVFVLFDFRCQKKSVMYEMECRF